MERYVDDSKEIGKIDMKAMKEDDGNPTGNRELFLRECKSEAGLWKIIDRYVDEGKEIVRGWMVTYVDDLLVVSRGRYGRRILEEVRAVEMQRHRDPQPWRRDEFHRITDL